MLGFDAIGVLPLGSGPRISSNDYVLVADAGSYAITGSAPSLDTMISAQSGAYALTGYGALFGVDLTATAGIYSLTGSPATLVVENIGLLFW